MKAVMFSAMLLAAGAVYAHTPAQMDSMPGVVAPPPQGVAVSSCWVRLLPANAPSAGYFTIENAGDQPVTLVGVHTPFFDMAMLHHTSVDEQGVSKMREVDSVAVPAKNKMLFAPGGYHVMLEKPNQAMPLHVGDKLRMTLVFSGNEMLTTDCDVRAPGKQEAHEKNE